MGIRDLGTLGGSGANDYSIASGINDAGQVAGSSPTTGGELHAFITGPAGEGLMDLNSLVDLPQGLVLSQAIGINDSGQVVAIGIVPEPETYALMLAGLMLVGFIARRKKGTVDGTGTAFDRRTACPALLTA